MISKSLEPADYDDIKDGVRTLENGLAAILGGGFKTYIPHPHRRWEYGSAIEAYLRHFGLDTPTRALDMGCGHGPLGPALVLTTGATIQEMDNDFRLRKTRQQLIEGLDLDPARISFEVGDLAVTHLEPYDAVFCISVIEHVPEEDQDDAWENLASLVKPGGLLVVTTDFGASKDTPWTADSERNFKFDPERVLGVGRCLVSLGFNLQIEPAFNGPHVYDYTFFRWIARKCE